MNSNFGNRLGLVVAAGLAVAVCAAFVRQDAGKAQAMKITGKALMAVDELKWEPLPGIPGAEQARLVGDPAKGPHRAFFRYPVGLKSPPHTHSFGDRGVVVSGVLSLAVEGAPAKRLPPGSFFSLGAGIEHITAVEGDAPCTFFMEREGPFDVVVSEKK